ncbi:MAG: ABC transporter permease [Bacteroidales bacterium]|nr:ABC transporter permease [Bacteroidales bacterium]
MRILGVIKKSLKEQVRSFWLLLLTVSTAPFFVAVYDLITESYVPSYDILVCNNDKGIAVSADINLGDSLIQYLLYKEDKSLKISEVRSRSEAEKKIKSRKADLLMTLPEDFSRLMTHTGPGDSLKCFEMEFLGNLSDVNYMITAILAYSFVSDFVIAQTGIQPPFHFVETGIGSSGTLGDFEIAVPGLVIFSIIMLMLTASVAMIAEVENKTMLRLKLSKVTTPELMGGITLVQILVGFLSVLFTLAAAAALGYKFQGAVLPVFIVVLLTTISIIAFSLFIAAFSKSATQVLIIGNFPLFLFMFFTGAMFPMNAAPIFSIQGYGISLISLMSPTHAVSSLNKLLIMQEGFSAIVPEIICLVILSILYFAGGNWVFRKRHMRL